MFRFQISDYSDPNLNHELPELLRERMEAHSQQALPSLWMATDRLNAYAAKGPGREKRRVRYRIYGAILIFLGIFLLVPGLAEPRSPSLILAGAVGILAGVIEFLLVRQKKPTTVPAACQQEAKNLLAQRRTTNWTEAAVEILFDESAVTISSSQEQETFPYAEILSVFEAEHLWLLIYGDEKALLLQKKDLTEGKAAEFTSFILQKMNG